MSTAPDEFSLRRARLLMLVVLIVVAGGIALANLSSEPITSDFLGRTVFKGKPAERAFGWPLTWYWRTAKQVPAVNGVHLRWPVSRYSLRHLTASLAIWVGLLGGAAAGCEWVLRHYRSRLYWRPRAATLILLSIVAAPTVLANFSSPDSGFRLKREWHDDTAIRRTHVSYGGELDGVRRSLGALRASHRGIVVDARYEEFKHGGDLVAPFNAHDSYNLSFARRWLE